MFLTLATVGRFAPAPARPLRARIPGAPAQSLYQGRVLLRLIDQLGYSLLQRLYWHNPAKLPAPAAWVTGARSSDERARTCRPRGE